MGRYVEGPFAGDIELNYMRDSSSLLFRSNGLLLPHALLVCTYVKK